MQARQLPFEIAPSSLFSPSVRQLLKPFDPVLTRLFFREGMLRTIPEARGDGMSALRFAHELLGNLDISYRVPESELDRIPRTGPALVVANHPFGLLEGLLLLSLLEKVRDDYRIVANGILHSFPPLHERVIFVNPFEEHASRHENGTRLRASLEWLRKGGLLVTFPAGEVSHLNWDERSVVDSRWNTAAARLARKLGCPTVPLYFDGANSHRFQMAGTVHPRLRTLNLLNELLNKRHHKIQIRVGKAIAASTLKEFSDAELATEYLRARTYLLRPSSAGRGFAPFRFTSPAKQASVGTCVPADLMAKELAQLPADRVLAKNGEFSVYFASAGEIPNTLREIGRCRELTYRAVGEGTGRPLDLDRFDSYYHHIVLWHASDLRVAGAYRLAATPDILPTRGIGGLYSSTLFHYDPEYFRRIGPALELGRSFICREYQKKYAPLLLLWKGIARYVVDRPECAVLFGAVSVSRDYHSLSRTLIVDFLKGPSASSGCGTIRPRHAFHPDAPVPKHVRQLGRLLPTVEELSASIGDLESDGKGLPILIKQYLKIGGQLIGCNVDPKFSDALDVLVMADLRTASGPMLERLMSRSGAESFRNYHRDRPACAPAPFAANN